MSTWWRVCQECGENSGNPWRCETCGAPVTLREPGRDFDLLVGLFVAAVGVVGVIALFALVIQIVLGGHP